MALKQVRIDYQHLGLMCNELRRRWGIDEMNEDMICGRGVEIAEKLGTSGTNRDDWVVFRLKTTGKDLAMP